MGKKVKGGARLDKYYRLSKEQGYRSRASFKLLQLESKFNFLESARSVLDLCAAPGGWMQVAVKNIPVGGFVLGVDLYPIKPIRGAISIIEDITTDKCRTTIKRLMKENGVRGFDVVLHDGSPNIGGAWAQEATVQTSLVVDAVRLATEFLSPKGTIVTKIFRSQDYNKVLYCLNKLFDKVEVTKPVASRSTSAETYIVGKKYKAPAKIDPRLLDIKYLFDVEQEKPKVKDVFGEPETNPRIGYGNVSLLRTVVLASDFVWSEIPLEVLGLATSISFKDPACVPLKDHILTTKEVKALCEDLQVLGKTDFKHLMKWRINLRKALSPTQKATPKPTDADNENKADDEGDDDDKMLNEMEELTYAMERKKKRAKKVAARRQAKDKLRKSTGMLVDALEDGYVDDELFSLSSIKGKKGLEAVDSVNYEDGNLGDSENDEYETSTQNDPSSDIDTDEEKKRYDEQIEDLLDEAYEQYITRKEGSSQQRKRSKKAFDEKELYKGDDAVELDQDSDREMVASDANPLMISLQEEEAQTQEQVTQQWFSQDIFAEAAEVQNISGKKESENEMEVDTKENMSVHSNNSELPKTRVSKAADNDFEVVPAAITDSSDYNRYTFVDELPPWFLEEEKRRRQQMKPVTKEANLLMISLEEEEAQTQEQVTQHWFSQDIFAEVENISRGKESENKIEVDIKENMSVHSNNSELLKTRVSKAADDDFEVVPAAITDSSDDSSASSSSNESEEEDNDEKAEILASAKKMLKKKQREALLDDAYNKYIFDDDKLPAWFLEEEKKHRQQMRPVTKEEVAAMKAHFKEIDARTPKKIAQAKARKKRVALRQRENVKRKANAISDQTDINDISKSKMIDKLYRKAAPKRPKKEYVVAKKGVQVKAPGKGKVLVDRRMKKDKRTRMR